MVAYKHQNILFDIKRLEIYDAILKKKKKKIGRWEH